MKLLEQHPNLLSALLLGAVSVVAVIFGLITYRSQPDQLSFSPVGSYKFRYQLGEPDQRFNLPAELEEISGLAYYQANTLFTIQDESGVLYEFDLEGQRIQRRIAFGKDRDYEGVTYHDGKVYVLEKDGDLHLITNLDTTTTRSDKYETEFSYRNDTEGITYDPVTDRLLIVPKEQDLAAKSRTTNRRGVYAFDLSEIRLLPDPVYYIDEDDLGEVVFGRAERQLMKPSAIAVEPKTGHLFILSSVSRLLVVIDRQSHILHVEVLRRSEFKQPEGITFSPDGDLFISNEGRGTGATLLRYSPIDTPPATDIQNATE